MAFRSTKVIDGFSTTFRQYGAGGTHCRYIHGYSVNFKLTFEGELDDRNWVIDYGFVKRSPNKFKFHNGITEGEYNIKEWFDMMFDHTTVISQTDPSFSTFLDLHNQGACQLRVVPIVGCEMFAKLVYDIINENIVKHTNGRVRLVEVECFEHAKNSAIYYQ